MCMKPLGVETRREDARDAQFSGLRVGRVEVLSYYMEPPGCQKQWFLGPNYWLESFETNTTNNVCSELFLCAVCSEPTARCQN